MLSFTNQINEWILLFPLENTLPNDSGSISTYV